MTGGYPDYFNSRTKNFRYSIIYGLTKWVTPKLYEEIQNLRLLAPIYCFTLPQLIFLCHCIEQVREVKGAMAEVGVFEGHTTEFINRYMDATKIEKKYYAIDTFSGFVPEDIDYEVSKRQKDPSLYAGFKTSKKDFDSAMKRNDISRVVSIQADVNKYDLTSLGPLSFVLLDVDLYKPIKKSLKELYSVLSPNGIIIVDDCNDKSITFDGSDQAYKEFMQEIDQPVEIVLGKLGIVRK
jgi:O-methyltransferase